MQIKHCTTCSDLIVPLIRAELYDTCIPCSKKQTKRTIGFMEYGHKTAGYVVTINADNEEGIRRAKRAFKRAR